ncbi:MAG: sterol desaturase family protein [Bacteroidia bacterium]|nr:sterol desaturase family protein [Bacteroidia bacterium]
MHSTESLHRLRGVGAFRVLLPPLIVYGSVAGVGFALSLAFAPVWKVALVAGSGWLCWTLVEYLIHRFAFHEKPGRPLAQKYDIHWIHHRKPHSPEHIVTSLRLTIPVALVFGGLFWLLWGGHVLFWAFYSGFVIGYLWYEGLHLSIHVWPQPPFRWLRPLWRHHHWHHFRDPHKYHGVTTRWWDYVFGSV